MEHNVKELSVGLGMQLIKNHTVGIKAMLVRHICRQHLVGGVGRQIGDLLLGFQDLYPLGKRWAEPHHIHRHIKDNLRLVAVSGTAIYLGTLLAVPAQEQERHSGGKLRFALFLRYLDVRRIELPIAVGLQNSKQVSDDLLLPVDQLKGLACPGALGMAERLDKHHCKIGSVLIVV